MDTQSMVSPFFKKQLIIIETYFISLHLALLYSTDGVWVFVFYKLKGNTSTSKKIMTHNCNAHFVEVVWN